MGRFMLLLITIGLLCDVPGRAAFTGATPRVYYYSGRQVQELWWDSLTNQWHARPAGQEANAPQISDPLGFLAGFAVGVSLDPRVYYVSANAQLRRLDIEELAYDRESDKWSARNLSGELNAPGVGLTSRGLAGFGTGINLDPRVYYVDAGHHVQELAWFDQQWHLRDISRETGIQAASCPVAFGTGSGLDPRVYCIDATGDLRELAWFDNAWHLRDLSQEFSAPAPAGTPVGFGVGADLDPRLYYTRADKHIEELAWFGNTWHLRDVTELVSAPASAGTELLVGFAAGSTLDPRVYYVDASREVEELAWFTADQMWHLFNATAPGAVPSASFGAGTAVGTALDPRIYLFDRNREVEEAAGDSRETAPWLARSIGAEATGPAADPGSRMIAFGVGGPTVRLDGQVSFQTVVDQNPPGTTFIVNAGVHRLQKIIPKDGDSFIGERDSSGHLLSTLNGAKILPEERWIHTKTGYWVTALGVPGFQRGIRNGQCTDAPSIAGKTKVESSIIYHLPCIYPEALFRDDVLLKRVNIIADLQAGPDTWYFDYSHMRVYVAGDPTGHKMEIALTPFAFGYAVAPGTGGNYLPARRAAVNPSLCDPFALDMAGITEYSSYPSPECGDPLPNPFFPGAFDTYKPGGVVIRNLIVEKYANPAQTGAIGWFRPGLDWQIVNNEVRYNHGSGIKFKGKAVVVGNYSHHNGEFGIESGDGNTRPEFGGHLASAGDAPFNGLPEWGYWGGFGGSDALVANNVISNNNVVTSLWNGQDMRFDAGWGAGGAKFSQTENLLAAGNAAENNTGPGLWTDFAYDGTTYLGNVIRKNHDFGGGALFHEVSGSADIVCNTVEGNTFNEDGDPPRNSEIFISNSHEVNVRLNKTNVSSFSDVFNINGNAITVEDAGFRTNEELPAYAFKDSVRQNDVTFPEDFGLAGLAGSTGIVIKDPAVVVQHLSTVIFDENTWHADRTQTHWLGLKSPSSMPPDITSVHLTFDEFNSQHQDVNGTVNSEMGSLPSACSALISAGRQLTSSATR